MLLPALAITAAIVVDQLAPLSIEEEHDEP